VVFVGADFVDLSSSSNRNGAVDTVKYFYKFPETIHFVNPDAPFQTPGDQAIFADGIYAASDGNTRIGTIYGFCLLTESIDPGPGSVFCQNTVQLNDRGTFDSTGVIVDPLGEAAGTSSIAGGTGEFLYAQGELTTALVDSDGWLADVATFRKGNTC